MICSYKIPLPERAFFHIHSVRIPERSRAVDGFNADTYDF